MTDITSAYVYAPCRQDSIVRSTTNQLSFRNRKPEKKSKISQVNIGEPIDLSRPTLTNTETATKWFRVYFAEGEEETTNS